MIADPIDNNSQNKNSRPDDETEYDRLININISARTKVINCKPGVNHSTGYTGMVTWSSFGMF